MPEMHPMPTPLWVIYRSMLGLAILVRLTSSGPIQVLLANDPTYPPYQGHFQYPSSSSHWQSPYSDNKQRTVHSISSGSFTPVVGEYSHRVHEIRYGPQSLQIHENSEKDRFSGNPSVGVAASKESIKENRFGRNNKKGPGESKPSTNDVIPKEESGRVGTYGRQAGLEWEDTIQVEVVTRRFDDIGENSVPHPESNPKEKSREYKLHRAKVHTSSKVRNSLLRPKPLLDHFHGLHFGIMDPADFPQRPPVKPSYSVEGTFLWAVGLFGTVENGAVLLTAIFSKKFKKPLHLLIGSLAVTDLFVSLIYIPSYTYYLLEGDRMLQRKGEEEEEIEEEVSDLTYCKLSRSIFIEIASVTLTIKALIAFYFYISACSREKVSQIFSTKNTLLFIFLAWGMNFVMLFIPKMLGYQEVDFYPNSFICATERRVELNPSFSRGSASAVFTFVTLSIHIAELMIIGACFVKVHMAIMRGKTYSDKHRSTDKDAKVNYMRALKITCLVFVTFCICWLPIYMINILDPSHENLPTDIHHLVMDLLLLKSSINPAIYIYGIRSLRYQIKLLCLCRCRSDNNKDLLLAHKAKSSSEGGGGASGTFSTLSVGI